MNRNRRKSVLFAAGFAALLLLFTFLDLPLSKALFHPESPFGNMFAGFAELPCTLLGVFSCAALVVTRKRENKVLSAVSLVGFGLLTLLFSLMAGFLPLNYLPLPKAFLLMGVVYAVAALVLSLRLAGRDEESAATLRRLAVLGILLVLAAMVIINIVKIFWGRPRMRSMSDPDAQFVFWFIPQGLAAGEEFKSFPSGHSANAACILWITLLPALFPRLRTKRAYTALNCTAYGWIVLTMVSRIIMGAHFATDVLMGAGITALCFYLLKWKFCPSSCDREQEAIRM